MSEPQQIQLADDGIGIPNSPLPLLVYAQAVAGAVGPGAFERLFRSHGWSRSWRNGIFAYRHYHSTAHEVLGIAHGSARVEFGGQQGVVIEVSAGDAVLIPAGVSHFNLGQSDDLLVVGAYADGAPHEDLCRDTPAERQQSLPRIAAVPKPQRDPVSGIEIEAWS